MTDAADRLRDWERRNDLATIRDGMAEALREAAGLVLTITRYYEVGHSDHCNYLCHADTAMRSRVILRALADELEGK